MFLDRAKIYVKAGDGGHGFVGFRREKYVPAGGPAGGDGGKGGSIIFRADPNLNTLIDFKYRQHFKAANGDRGQNKNQYGKNAEDLIIGVPPGTVIKHGETGEVIADLVQANQQLLLLPGGRGGRGNSHFATPTRQAPAFAERGDEGQELWIDLELKLIADAGLVGYPNAGKSTLISVVSAAKPKIADYPFTTLVPNLGVVSLAQGVSFVLADIPGIIEGAHRGVGLGTDFLRHVERTRLIIHVVDAAGVDGRDPADDYRQINEELQLHSAKLAALPQVIVANKMDLPGAQENYARLVELTTQDKREIFPVSAATSQGTNDLMEHVGQLLRELQASQPEEVTKVPAMLVWQPETKATDAEDFTVRRADEDYVVEGAGLERLMKRLDLNNAETLEYLQRLFAKIGLYQRLKDAQVPAGATVHVGEIAFEYVE